MTRRKHTPIHDFWRPRVEGQIRDAMQAHPEWFASTSNDVVVSIAKRIVGEIVAGVTLATMPTDVAANCTGPANSGGGCYVAARPEGGGFHSAPLLEISQ